AYGVFKRREAENALDEKIIQRDLLLALIERAPQLVGELMTPARQIESIKILDINGLNMDGGGGETSGIGRVIQSFLSAGAALPLLKEFLDFAKADPEQLLKKVAEQLPGIKEALGEKGSDR
ncbi:MAG: flotillin domain-containing protein, partial [Dehalococcoidia bacterium]